MDQEPGRDRLAARIAAAHRDRFGAPPRVLAFAPGRVEILGNHTDYNEGFVLSAALDSGTVFSIGPSRRAGRSEVFAADVGRGTTFRTGAPERDPDANWADYVKGVLPPLTARRGRGAPDFSAAFGGDLPVGAGLSSSAALTVSAALALSRWMDLRLAPLEMATIAQRAEHEYAGTRCGLLDPITSLSGEPGKLVLTDFRSLRIRRVPMSSGACFLLCHTGIRHRLADSEYNERRGRCEAAAARLTELLGRPVPALRDVSAAELEAVAARMDPNDFRRAAHVVGENERVGKGVEALKRSDWKDFGQRMNESHESSRRHFENSCPELDQAVESAREIEGIHGARLTGGGFGGSAIALVDGARAMAAGAAWSRTCERRWGRPAEVRIVVPSAGARLVPDPGI